MFLVCTSRHLTPGAEIKSFITPGFSCTLHIMVIIDWLFPVYIKLILTTTFLQM